MPRQGKAGKVFSKCEKGTWQFHSLCNIYSYLKPLRQRGLHNKALLAEREFKWTHFALSAPGSHIVEVLLLARVRLFCVCVCLCISDQISMHFSHTLGYGLWRGWSLITQIQLQSILQHFICSSSFTWTLIGRYDLIILQGVCHYESTIIDNSPLSIKPSEKKKKPVTSAKSPSCINVHKVFWASIFLDLLE